MNHKRNRGLRRSAMTLERTLVWMSLGALLALSPLGAAEAKNISQATPRWKILHIMSYHSPWKWTDDQLKGFQAALRGLNIEYKTFQMDTKRRSSEKWKRKVAAQAIALIKSYKPDLVYVSDDNALKYVVSKFINSKTPFVFSGVNADPKAYGLAGASNVAGVMEQEHFIPTVELLKQIAPQVKKIAVIVDDGPTWPGVVARMKAAYSRLPDAQIVSWHTIKTFREFQQTMLRLQNQVDAVALLGIFTFKDEKGDNVNYADVLRWTAENSKLPDFSFWRDRVSFGTLCAVSVSGYEQGLAAGKIAREILLRGKRPASFPIMPTLKGEPAISLARANKLGLKIKSRILLSGEIVTKFQWNK